MVHRRPGSTAATTARTPPAGAGRTAALHTTYFDDDTRCYRAFDYLIAADDGQNQHPLRPISENYWHNGTRDCDPRVLAAVGFTAYGRDEASIALNLFREAVDAGNTGATHMLGILLAGRGDHSEAEARYREAIDAGDIGAMFSLGNLLEERGDLKEAESWYRKAIDAGHTYAIHHLDLLLAERDKE